MKIKSEENLKHSIDYMVEERAAKLLFKTFAELPRNCKPRDKEWVPLTGIIAQFQNGSLSVLSLATGMKCLYATQIPRAQGKVLHDSHSEILAFRAFNAFLLRECRRILLDDTFNSEVLERYAAPYDCDERSRPFIVKEGIKLFVVSTELPCGDASMETVMAAQEDSTPWPLASHGSPSLNEQCSSMLRGRGHFSELGRIRTKPGRGDSPPTLSKSCTDKIALKQALSMLQCVTSLIISPTSTYVDSLFLPSSSHSSSSLNRAFSSNGRLKELAGRKWDGGYEMRYFNISSYPASLLTSNNDGYRYTRESAALQQDAIAAPSNISTVYLPSEDPPYREVLINGVQMGRKAFSGKGASALSKHSLWATAMEVAILLKDKKLQSKLNVEKYCLLKGGSDNQRSIVGKDIREVLTANIDIWERNGNIGGDDFGLTRDSIA